MLKKIHLFNLFFISLSALVVTVHFFRPGFFVTQDGEWAIIRTAEMKRELQDLQLPPRWSDYLNHGVGYPLFHFTYPLPFYLSAAVSLLGISLTQSVKIIFIVSVFVSGFGMYHFALRYWGASGALVSSLFFLFMPYRIIDLYVRGSVGEIVALAIIPWLLFVIDRSLFTGKSSRILALLTALLVVSHNVSSLLFLGMVAIFLLSKLPLPKQRFSQTILFLVLGILLSTYFWLPAIAEKRHIYLGSNPIANRHEHFVPFSELFFQNPNQAIRPPLIIGFPHILALFLGIILLIRLKKDKAAKRTVAAFVTLFLVSIFFTSSNSSYFWQFPLLKEIDFPWRFLLLTGFSASFLAGGLVKITARKEILMIVVFLTLYSYANLIKISSPVSRENAFYESNDATTTSNDELMPVWVKVKTKNRNPSLVSSPAQTLEAYTRSNRLTATLYTPFAGTLTLNKLYFPGWHYYLNGKEINTSISPTSGKVLFTSPAGTALLEGKLSKTPVQKFADTLSLVILVILLVTSKSHSKLWSPK